MRNTACLFILFLSVEGYGQFNRDSIRIAPGHAIKFSPLHLINFYPTIQLAYEHGLSKRFSVQVDGGYVVNYSNAINERFQNKRGVKMKAELRYYFMQSRKAIFQQYVTSEVYYNRINFDRSSEIVECFDLDCRQQFQRSLSYNVQYREPGISVKYGLVIYIHDFFFDFNTGLSLRFIDYDEPFFQEAALFQEDGGWFAPDETDRTAPGLVVGIRIGYRIK